VNVCDQWLADDFLVRRGFTIRPAGPGQSRTAIRGDYTTDLAPACTCPDCPPTGDPMDIDPASREGRLAALDQLLTITAANLRDDDTDWCAHRFWEHRIAPLVAAIRPAAGQLAEVELFAKLPDCRTACLITQGWDAA
jgi:hypothetical protein